MRPYEVMVILDAALEEDVIRSVVDRATELLRSRDANPGRVETWGKRRLAYELNHRTEGYYVLMETTGEPAAMAELDRMLSLADEVIRHKIIRLPEHVAGRRTAPPPAPSAGEAPAEAGAPANGA
ncbi:MAG TPA: 30S ribosomal protein S6 [Acidimicrobiales bacterium]|nr:30S ribosomal protein S6 [Acidimicrobiales bacterium]